MVHLLRRALPVLVLVSAVTGNDALAQDILLSTGTSTRSYNYAEVQYLTNVDQSTPFLVTGLLDISRGFALTGEYTNQREQLISDSADLSGEARTDQFTVGVLYHDQLKLLNNTDWFAEVAGGRLQVKVDTNALKFTKGIMIARVAAGVRRTVTERLELEARVEGQFTEGTFISRESFIVTASGRAVFRVMRNFDLALSIDEMPNTNIIGLGFRLTW